MSTVISIRRPTGEATLVKDWRLLKTQRPSLHLYGRFLPSTSYWASPAIVRIDAACRSLVAANGALYRLIGEPGSSEAAAEFVSLCSAFDKRLVSTRDVTLDVLC
ncbi:hypothetical protein ACU4GI_14510 [Cupriavidus basilensis]